MITLMTKTPFYDYKKSYEENYKKGPFGAFADGVRFPESGEPTQEFLGYKLYLPFGIPAGPLLNSKFIKGALEKGFDLVTYKTVRSAYYKTHRWPNVMPVKIEGDLTLDKAQDGVTVTDVSNQPKTITNSFGVPSMDVAVWQEDVKRALTYVGKGQLLVLSFMGTVREQQTKEALINDFAVASTLAKATGVKVLEINLSCPNVGNEGLVCFDLDMTEKVLSAVRRAIGTTPLIVKVGHYTSDDDLARLAEIVDTYAQAVATVNTIQAKVTDEKGAQALPGKGRIRSGIAGSAIKWAGIDMVKRLKKLREKFDLTYEILGMGGVITPLDYLEYRKAGADVVQSATGAMWNPYLAQEIKRTLSS